MTGVTGPITPWTTTVDAANNALKDLKTGTFNSEIANSATGGTLNIDLTAGQKQKITVTANTTLTFTAPLGPGNFLIRVIQGGAGGFLLTFPTQGQSAGNFAWANKTVITLSTAVGAEDVIAIYYNGSYYDVSYNNNFG